MAHKLIVGQTLSGKSTLAKAMVSDCRSRGIVPAIYDPTLSPEWESEYVTDDERQYLRILKHLYEKDYAVFGGIDEADTVLSMSHRHNWWLFQRGRHFGFELCGITQRPQLVAPTIRGNSGELYVFNVGKNDALFLADDQAAPGLIDAPTLRQGEFLRAMWIDGEKKVDKLRIF